jgi:SpoVK/Ycf46/Vps4 family AAA+-type ATPase
MKKTMLYKLSNGEIRIGEVHGIGAKLSLKGSQNYLVKRDRNGEYHLVETQNFILPSKIYGESGIIKRWLKSYEFNSHKNLGILLSGLKGSGKTILAQKFCIDSGKPVIIITEPWSGPDFVDFISSPTFEDCIIFIDEFEKIYPEDTMSTDILSLFDGNLITKLIFLITVNNVGLVSQFLINRPSRIKYRKDYDSLDLEIINEVIEDLLNDKSEKDNLILELKKIGVVTFDILITIIKDMNLFNESAKDVIKHLNIKNEPINYSVFEVYNGIEYKCSDAYIAPMNDDFTHEFYLSKWHELTRACRLLSSRLFQESDAFYSLDEDKKKQFISALLENNIMTIEDFNYVLSNVDSYYCVTTDEKRSDEWELFKIDINLNGIKLYNDKKTLILKPTNIFNKKNISF